MTVMTMMTVMTVMDSDDSDGSDGSDDSSDSGVEWVIESIVGEHTTASGGKEYLVKWAGSNEETWEPAANLSEAIALDKYLGN